MIKEFNVKNYLSFHTANLKFKKGLIVFSGPSGSGKSILMNSLLNVFSLKNTDAERVEAILENNLDLETNYGIETFEENYFSKQKKEKTRFFINSQPIPKKKIQEISSTFLKYLHLKDYSDFDNNNLINLLDIIVSTEDKKYPDLLLKYRNIFDEFNLVRKKLNKVLEEEKNIEDLKEFAQFELSKIEAVNPNIEESENILEIKSKLSKKEQIEEQIEKCQQFLYHQNEAYKLLNILNVDESFLMNSLSELETIIDNTISNLNELNEWNIEELLDKIEGYSELKRKYGSVEEAIKYKEIKIQEIEHYNNLSFEKSDLEKQLSALEIEIEKLSNDIHNKRKKILPIFVDKINYYLNLLYIEPINISLDKQEKFSSNGNDIFNFILKHATLDKISTGEFNRLRLSLLALQTEYNDNTGILMLDEIDSNLSGEESMSVAKVLKILSKKYQIFAISHLPQLTASADQHFLISKNSDNISSVQELDINNRIKEIARLISGKDITEEALSFAGKFIIENKSA